MEKILVLKNQIFHSIMYVNNIRSDKKLDNLDNVEDFKYHIITVEDKGKKEVFLEYFLGNSPEEAESIYKEFSTLLNKMAYSYSCASGLEKRDLFAEALVGLARAKRDYNLNRSVSFKNYAIFLIKNSINDYIRKLSGVVSIPAYIKLANANILAIKSILLSFGIENGEIEYILDQDKLNEIKMDSKNRKNCINHITNLKNAADRCNISLKDLIKRSEFIYLSSSEYDENDITIIEEQNTTINNIMIDKLTNKMCTIDKDIAQRLLDGQSFEEIGMIYGKSRNWAKQRLSRFGSRILKGNYKNDK